MDEVDAPPPEMEPAVEPDEPEEHAEEPSPGEPPASSPNTQAAMEAPSPNTGRAAVEPPPPDALAAMDPPPPDAGLEMTAPREERKEDAAAEDDDDDGADADESQVFLLHPRFEALSIRSGFSKVELEGLDGPRLLRTSFLLFSIQVAWFFALALLFGAGMLSFEALGAEGARDDAAGIFTFALLSQIVVLVVFAALLQIGIRGVARRDPALCGRVTYLQLYRVANVLAVVLVALLCVASVAAIRAGVRRRRTRLGTLLLVVQLGALAAKVATVAVAVVVAGRARNAFLGFAAAKQRPAPARAPYADAPARKRSPPDSFV